MNYAIGHRGEARSLVLNYHYSRRFPGNVIVVGTAHAEGGLFGDMGEAVAACVFGIPANNWSINVWELQRLVRTPLYTEPLTSLISFTVKYIKRTGRVNLLVSYADWDENHHGGIYQAASWNYAGKRPSQTLGAIIDGVKVHGRTLNNSSGKYALGTRSIPKLRELYPDKDIQPWTDSGKHLYWKALNKKGKAEANSVGLESLPYCKPEWMT